MRGDKPPLPTLVQDLPDPPPVTDADINSAYEVAKRWREFIERKRREMEMPA